MAKLRRRVVVGAVCTLATALACTIPAVQSAAADPVSDAKSQLAELEAQNSKIDADYAQVQSQLATSRERLKTTTADLASQQKLVNGLKTDATRVALAQFQNRGVNVTTRILTSPDADTFLSQLSTTEQVESNMNSTLQDYQNEVGSLESLKKTVASETASIATDESRLKQLQSNSDGKVSEAKALVSRLTTQQQAALAADQQQTTRTASSIAGQVSRSATRTPTPSVSGSASSRAKAALEFAIAQVGKSYVLGTEGPNTYDCSGLVMAAYASVGISLPRTTYDQVNVGQAVSRSNLQPGDLVFFYDGPSHVGIYMGNGIMVDARNSRVGVVYTNINEPWWPFNSARRVA